MKWNHHAAKSETAHCYSWVFAKAKELHQSSDFSELFEKLVIVVARCINAREFTHLFTFTASIFQTQAASLALKKREVD